MKYVLGIDLGTTSSVLAYAPLGGERPEIAVLPIPQLVAASTVEARPGLPSFLYLASGQEGGGAHDLPWAKGRNFAVGELARRQSAEMPEATVGAAKSWLAHTKVDRHQPILPWGASPEMPKVSPVTATRRYLEHIVAAWQQAMPDAPIAEQAVVVTVPASFDASARELTREAALQAGLPENFVLLEEPQAAIYAWLDAFGEKWRRLLKVGETLLVVDVGGGTSDFTLVGVAEETGELTLRRHAVGNHLLVGGDNMDLALAHFAAEQFSEKGVSLDPWQSVSLWHSCRAAKETLLGPEGPKKHSLTVAGRGSRLIGKAVSIELQREATGEMLVDGFFPRVGVGEKPAKRRVSGFQEIGLPFEGDTAITRHLAAFLSVHGEAGRAVRPTHMLLNGGVFKAPRLAERLMEVLAAWFPDAAPQLLAGKHDLENAVARGAAYYAWAKECGGVRIRGGTARSYYVGIESAGLAIPGAPRPLRALCVVPIGMEEGTETDVPSGEIGLVVGEPAQFRFFSSGTRKQDKPGDVIPSVTTDELNESDSLEATLTADEQIDEPYVPVKFHSKITELGMFELWCVSPRTGKKWKLEFSVREE